MATDPKSSLPPKSSPESLPAEIQQALASGLADFNLRELLAWLLSRVGQAERQAYLERTAHDKPNGFYDRSLQLGAIPLEVQVPRTRSGDFRPATLPPPYQRGYPEETQALLLGLLASARSLNAAKEALQKMGLSGSQQELDRVAIGLIEELDLRNSRPIDPDLLAVFLDGKYIEFRDGDRLRSACIYVVLGLRRDGRKQILTCLPRPGRENLEDWKLVLRGLIERGLRRVLILESRGRPATVRATLRSLCQTLSRIHRRGTQKAGALSGLRRLSGIDPPFLLHHQCGRGGERPTGNPAPQQRRLLSV
jgi:transposase-like protein